MKTHQRRTAWVVKFLVVTMAIFAGGLITSGCDFGPNVQNQDQSVDALLLYYGPENGYGTSVATVKMWAKRYAGGVPPSQSSIVNWVAGDVNLVSSSQMVSVLNQFGSTSAYFGVYPSGDTCNGNRSCSAQALADTMKAVDLFLPPAAELYGLFGMIKAHGIHKDCFAIGPFNFCQPRYDYVKAYIPAFGYGDNVILSPGEFNTALLNGGSESHIYFHDSNQFHGMTNSDWADWDYYAGTYYGDPDPPDPNCEIEGACTEEGGGGDDDPPLEGFAVAPGARSPRALRRHGVVRLHPKVDADVVANFVAAVKTMRLNKEPGMESLTLEDGKLTVSSVVRVRALGPAPDYFLLTIVTKNGLVPFAEAAVSSDGLFRGLHTWQGQPPRRPAGTPAEAIALLKGSVIFEENLTAEAVYAQGELGLTVFEPSFLIKTSGGLSYLVTPAGAIYLVTSEGTNLTRQTSEKFVAGKDRRSLAVLKVSR